MSKGPAKKAKRRLGLLVLCLLGMVLFRNTILRSVGNYLVVEDPKQKVDAIYVLSGNSFDRGGEAARLFREGWAPKVVCLGGETNPALELYGIHDLSSTQTANVLAEAGVPRTAIELLPEGTSTYEEFQAIARHCQLFHYQKVMVVSSLFHTRRIDTYFRERLYFSGVEMVLRGVQDGGFTRDAWWKSEPGLIFVNNEYIKMMYYWLKY